jgi:hypothetical protein
MAKNVIGSTFSTSFLGSTSNPLYASNDYDTASTSANVKNHGLTIVPYSTAAQVFTLDAPVMGVRKTIAMNSTRAADSTSLNTAFSVGSATIKDNSTTYAPKTYAVLRPPFASAELIGLSTSEWGVISSFGEVKFSTAATYST